MRQIVLKFRILSFVLVAKQFNSRVTTVYMNIEHALYVECDNEREIRTTVRRQLFCINTNFSKATYLTFRNVITLYKRI